MDSRIQIEKIDDAESDNEITRHHLFNISIDRLDSGTVLASLFDYGRMESLLMSSRWLSRPLTYLWPLRSTLFEQNVVRARLSSQLSSFSGSHRRLVIIDSIAFDEALDYNRVELIREVNRKLRDFYRPLADFVVYNGYSFMAQRLSVSSRTFIDVAGESLAHPIDEHIAVARIPDQECEPEASGSCIA